MLNEYELDEVNKQQFIQNRVNVKRIRKIEHFLKNLTISEKDKKFIQKWIKFEQEHFFNKGKQVGEQEFKKQLFEMIKPDEE
jgi:hypothetical protein